MIVEPKKPFKFYISDSHVAAGVRCDTNNCAIAQAARSECLAQGKQLLAIQIGPQRVVLVYKGREARYATPSILRKALNNFDLTGAWDLPEGVYQLNPLPKSLTRKEVNDRAKKRTAAGDPNKLRRYKASTNPKPRHVSLRIATFESERPTVASIDREWIPTSVIV